MRASLRQLVALSLALVAACAAAVAALVVVPSFESMFAPYRSELDPRTHILFATYRWWAVLVVAVVVAWFSSTTPARGARVALVVGVGGAFVLTGFGWWALQQPDIMLKLIEGGAP